MHDLRGRCPPTTLRAGWPLVNISVRPSALAHTHARARPCCCCRCAIVGLTEQVVFQQISKQQYMLWRKELADYVGKLEVADAEVRRALTRPAPLAPTTHMHARTHAHMPGSPPKRLVQPARMVVEGGMGGVCGL